MDRLPFAPERRLAFPVDGDRRDIRTGQAGDPIDEAFLTRAAGPDG
ncbi:hypothetical protein Q1M63_19165 [Sinorhizobium meliloti]|jgi:hypothetical protein|nr:hypothetical protein Q1M63_19165 [Sinorhizobium meliloti]